MAKVHLYAGDSPLGTGSRADTLCDKELWDVRILAVWDLAVIGAPLDVKVKDLCSKCEKKSREGTRGRQYAYAISEGER